MPNADKKCAHTLSQCVESGRGAWAALFFRPLVCCLWVTSGARVAICVGWACSAALPRLRDSKGHGLLRNERDLCLRGNMAPIMRAVHERLNTM